MSEVVIKYKNRKLYSTTLSRYVTADYVLKRSQERKDVKVLEHKTNVDLTQRVILRAELEDKLKNLGK